MTSRRQMFGFARHDADIAIAFVLLLMGGFVLKPLIVVAFAVAVVFIGVVVARALLRRRTYKLHPPEEFWADRIKE